MHVILRHANTYNSMYSVLYKCNSVYDRMCVYLCCIEDIFIQVNQIDFLDALDSGISGNLKKGVKVLGMCYCQIKI